MSDYEKNILTIIDNDENTLTFAEFISYLNICDDDKIELIRYFKNADDLKRSVAFMMLIDYLSYQDKDIKRGR